MTADGMLWNATADSGKVINVCLATNIQAFHSRGDVVAVLDSATIFVLFEGANEVQKVQLADNELVTAIEFGIDSQDSKVAVYYQSKQWKSTVESQ